MFFLVPALGPLPQRRGVVKRGSCAHRGRMHSLCKHLWLCAESAHSGILSPSVVGPDLLSVRLWHAVGRTRAFVRLRVGVGVLWLQELKWLCCHQRSGLLLGYCCLSKHQHQLPHLNHTSSPLSIPRSSLFCLRSRAKLWHGVGVCHESSAGSGDCGVLPSEVCTA